MVRDPSHVTNCDSQLVFKRLTKYRKKIIKFFLIFSQEKSTVDTDCFFVPLSANNDFGLGLTHDFLFDN